MEKIIYVLLFCLIFNLQSTQLWAQGVGIGTNTPNHKLDVLGGNTSLDKYVLIKDFDNLTEFTRLISRDNSLMGWQGGWVVGQYPNGGLPAGFGLTGTLLTKGQSAFAVTSGNVGIGLVNPEQKLDVRGNAIQWGNRSLLGTDQGGSLELGGNATVAGTGSPFIDFHFNGLTQNFNTRIINNGDGILSFFASDKAIFSDGIRMAGIGTSATNTTVITQNGTGDLEQRILPANVWDGDDNTTYTAGLGLTLTGTTFSSDLGGSIETGEITDGTVTGGDLNQMGATNNQVLTWNGTTWIPTTPSADGDWTISGINMYPTTATNVGIGTMTPLAPLHVATRPGIQVANFVGLTESFTSGRSYLTSNLRNTAGGWQQISAAAYGGNYTAVDFSGGTFSILMGNTPTVAFTTHLRMNSNGFIGLNNATPEQRLDLRGEALQWGNRSLLGTDQGGSMELGGNSAVAGTGSPFIDFHFNGLTQDFNTRIINDGDGILSFFASDKTIFSDGIRMAGIGTSATNTTVITQNGTGDLEQRALPANVWDGDDNTTYTAGVGIALAGTTFSNTLGSSIESAEITNGTVVAADLNQMGATTDQVLTWNGSNWLPITPDKTTLRDLDNDTKIYVEKNPDEDIIRFDLEGIERMKLTTTTGGEPRMDFNFNGIRIGALAGDVGIQSTGVMIGIRAGQNNTGAFNDFIGYHAGRFNTTGLSNIFVGTYAGTSNTTGSLNTFMGSYTGRFNTSGLRNVFIGASAGDRNTTANENTFIGFSAGENTGVGGFNTFVGSSAGLNNTAGSGNVFIGRQAGLNSQNTIRNTFVGMQVGAQNTTGNFNTFIGGDAGYGNTTGFNNTFVGQSAGSSSAGGYENVMLGYQAGSGNAGNLNVFIGHKAGQMEIGSEKLYIDNNSTTTPLIYGDFASNSLTFHGTVNIGGNYVLPISDGINGQMMTTDGVGNVAWSTVSSVFERDAVNNEIQPSGAIVIATDDFVFGSTQLDDLVGGQDNARFFFDKSKAAFRAGTVTSNEWNAVNVGNNSIAMGSNVLASGVNTVGLGTQILVTGQYAIGLGYNLTTNGNYSMSLGHNNINNSDYSVTIGSSNTATLRSMAGGTGNTANGNYALAWGGFQNESTGFVNTILGGYQNKIQNSASNPNVGYNTITGGRGNQIDSTAYSFIGSGESNLIENTGTFQNTKFYSAIVGGKRNRITYTANNSFEPSNFIGTGQDNIIEESSGGAIVGGRLNQLSNTTQAIVVGGENNRIESTNYAGILTGGNNHILQSSEAIITGGGRNFEQNSSNAFIGAGNSDSILFSGYSNIIGGLNNKIGSSTYATIAGGRNNLIGVTALGTYSFIAGGSNNVVNSQRSVSLGSYTNTNSNNGCFIFGDNSTTTATNNTTPNQFMVRAAGGTVFYTNSALTSGVQLASGAGAWATVSDRNKKENFEIIEGELVLSKIATMDIQAWNYKAQGAKIRHLGPTAQDFYAAFGLGESDTTITTVDIDGINLLAIQSLESRTQELKQQNKTLEEQMAIQAKEIELLKALLQEQIQELKVENKNANSTIAKFTIASKKDIQALLPKQE